MKTHVRSLARVLLLALSASAVAAATATSDHAAEQLARSGALPIASVGPYVSVGTFRVQVVAKLGQPDAKLTDDLWLYQRRRVERSDAEGTLVVRFTGGRVSSLALATPAVVAALRANPAKTGELLATTSFR